MARRASNRTASRDPKRTRPQRAPHTPAVRSSADRGQLRLLWGLLELVARPKGSGHLRVLWGLLRIGRRESGSWEFRAVWGLIRLTTPPVRARSLSAPHEAARLEPSPSSASEAPQPSPDHAPQPLSGDSHPGAVELADRQLQAVRRAAIIAGVGVGLGFLAWQLGAVLLATAAGVLASGFAERLYPKLVGREAQQVAMRTEAWRSTAVDHARQLENLSASIAHEIRNPITAAKSLVQQMGEDLTCADNIEYAEVALAELERVERSVSHLLRYAREEKKENRELCLVDAVDSALSALQDRADEFGVDIQLDCDTPGRIRGDVEQLRRIVLNLVGNAIDALAESKVQNPAIAIEVGDNLAGTEAWLRVSDNGPGIAPEAREFIFNPFHTSKDSGTGLGLAITKKLVEAHGGTVELKSAPAAGASFVLTFPKSTRDG